MEFDVFPQVILLLISTVPPCTAGLDIAIVLDKSQSVKLGNLKTVITFLGNLVKNFDPSPEADHFGLITFNKKAQMSFKLGDIMIKTPCYRK